MNGKAPGYIVNKFPKVNAVFIDLRKAFDTVDHTPLITKLKDIGFSPVIH